MLDRLKALALKTLMRRKMDKFYAEREDPYRFRTSRLDAERFAAMAGLIGDRRCERALEVGASQGDFTEILARRAARVTAVEVSEVASRRARERLKGLGGVEWICDDIRTWDAPAASFDLVVLAEVLYYLDKPLARGDFQAMFSRTAKWLAPGGRLLLVHGFVTEPQRLSRVGYREKFESLGLTLASERIVSIDPAVEPVQCVLSLLEKPLIAGAG